MASSTPTPAAAQLTLRTRRSSSPFAKRPALLALAPTVALLALVPAPAHAYGIALQTAVATDPPTSAEGELILTRIRAAGARFIRLNLSWRQVAPASPPPGFQPTNPNDPAYDWRQADRAITQALAAGLEPIVDVVSPPSWAQSPPGAGLASADPAQLGRFAAAAAARYGGATPGLPRVRYWEVWNEPNVSLFLQPQIQAGRVVSVGAYRVMIEDFAAAVHGVSPSNVVVAGELFPNGVNRPGLTAIAPLEFTRQLFCLSAGRRPHRVCKARVPVDVWSVHPYSSGGPTTPPANPNSVWIANLGALVATVRAAQQLGTLVSARAAQTWVTEFSWDSSPPDPRGVPMAIEQRWVAEAIYRAWSAGINVFTWFTLRDQPLAESPFQAGLYFACPAGVGCDTPKPLELSFRFPFVAYGQGTGQVLVWGRTPGGQAGQVQVQWLKGLRWRDLVKLGTDRDGIFTASIKLPAGVPAGAMLRAVELGVGPSPSFSLRAPPNVPATPFGS